MCKRDTTDPLVRHFLDEYGLNLLKRPRAGVDCGQAYVRDRHGGLSAPVTLDAILEPAPELPPIRRDEEIVEISGMMSHGVEREAALELLEAFMAAVGAGGFVETLKAGYRERRARSLRFCFDEPQREEMPLGGLANAIACSAPTPRSPLVNKGSEYYVIGAVVRTASVAIEARDERERAVELGAGVMAVADASLKVDASRSSEGVLTYTGRTPLTIGVELYEMTYDEDAGKLVLTTPTGALDIRRAKPADPRPVLLGGTDGDALVDAL